MKSPIVHMLNKPTSGVCKFPIPLYQSGSPWGSHIPKHINCKGLIHIPVKVILVLLADL